jgi:hypothetical protein
MRAAEQTELETSDKALEMDSERNVHKLRQAGVTFLQSDDAMPANNLAALLRRVSEASALEIDNLIGELRALRQKLETDHDRIQGDVAEYAKLSRGVMQLTADIPDSVNSLQSAPNNGETPYAPRSGR